ncbi:S-layer homology domain [Urinicoccus massiliensis]|uniref:S-layer homology domain n=1 Tax=Urinicoccus massiliensis TaxID=1723382 RepID=A0A8H2QWX6_9FIRM|nr:S-layer homology domain [Urinicoccus massiliensis]
MEARAKKLDNVIPATDSNGNPNKKPAGYKEVTFVVKADDAAKGSIQGVAKYYVNPKEYVKFDPPTTTENTGYAFGAWDKDVRIPTVYTGDTTVTASFNEAGNASANPTPGKTEVKVIFRLQGKGGGTALNSTNTYYVTPGKEVSLNPPKVIVETGYEFQGWNPDATVKTSYNADTIVTGTFKKLEDIVPGDQAKPDGYVRVEFRKGEHGMLEGQTVYYVNPEAGKTFRDLTKPTVKPDPGYQHTDWTFPDTLEIKRAYISSANYREIPPVVPQYNDQGQANTKPKGYIDVKFSTEANGIIKGKEHTSIPTDTKIKLVYVNPNKAVVLKDFAPTVKPNTGYEFARWDTSIERAIQYKDGDTIKALYNDPGDVSKTEVAGYVKVEFKPGDHGTLSGDVNLWIRPGKEINLPTPTVKPSVGFTFDKWDEDLKVNLSANSKTYVVTAGYTKLDDIISGDKRKPDGYIAVTFAKGDHGTLSGKTVYYVNPNANKTLADIIQKPTVTPETGWKFNKWDKDDTTALTGTQDITVKAEYEALEDVIEAKAGVTKPEGYLTVVVKPTDNAKDKDAKTYYVNPTKEVTIPFAKPVGKDVKVGEDNNNKQAYKWVFKNWTSDEVPFRTWTDELKAKFTNETTTITANYDKSITDQGSVTADQVTVHESYKKSETEWINNFIETEVTEAILKGALKVKGNPLPNDATVTFLDKDGNVKAYADLATELYDKLQEKDNVNNEPTRIEKVKAQVKFKNGEVQTVEIPIKVYKNIYEAKTEEGKPNYVPEGYVKVTVDPTTKAEKPQKYTYYVNPAAKVVIPGKDPVGTGDNKFVKWTYLDNGTETEYKLSEKPRHQFNGETTITAQYSGDIVPQTGTGKPDGVPDNFVSVEFKQGDHGTIASTETIKYWVNPAAGIKLSNIAHPSVTANEGWKHTGWDKEDNTAITASTNPLVVTAKYLEKVLTNTPTVDAGKYVTVEFKRGEHGNINAGQTTKYWVLKDAEVSLTIPAVTPNKKYAQKTGDDAWSPKIQKSYTADKEHIAQYDYNGENVIPQKGVDKPDTVPDNFVLVEFKPGSQGTIAPTETVKYWVNPTALVTLPAPKVTPNAGYEQQKGFNAWDHYLRDIFDKETVITAQYEKERGDLGGDWQTGTLGSTRILTVVEKEVVKVPAEKTFRKEVRYMQGFNNYFRPTEGLTRAEAAQILANALVEDGYRYDPNFTIRYKDIVGNEWYAKAIRITSQANVFKGYDTGYFDPHKKITRAEWIGTLRRFQELERAPGNHMQVRPDHWAMGEIEAAYKEGWLAIYGQGLARFNADEFIPRQEVAAVSNKAFNRVLDKTYIHRNSKNLINYKDVNPSMWSYEDILCASNGYLHDGKSFWGHKIDYKKDLYNINLDGYTVTKDKFQRLERR